MKDRDRSSRMEARRVHAEGEMKDGDCVMVMSEISLRCKVTKSREQNKIKSFIFYAETE